MIITVIDWDKHEIVQRKTDYIKYENDGIFYTYEIGNNLSASEKIKYEQLLGVEL